MKNIKSMTYLIIGLVLTGVGIGFTVFGTFKQGKEAQEFQSQVIESQTKSIELSEKLTKISEDKFYQLTKPVVNVIKVEENSKLGLKSVFKILAKNTGNNDCFNAKLIIDKHNSPLVGTAEIQSFTKIPKETMVEYTIPMFQSDLMMQIQGKEVKKEFEDIFLKRFQDGESAIVVFFHFEYEWNDETLKSSQFSILKSKGQKLYASSSENYIEPEKPKE